MMSQRKDAAAIDGASAAVGPLAFSASVAIARRTS